MSKPKFFYKGTRVSKGEKAISIYLESLGIKFIREKTFIDCISRNNRLLRFDFYIPSINVIIEYDGEHHFKPINKGYRAKYAHERTVINDKIKNKYIEDKGIGLLRITYKEFDDIKNIIDNLFKYFNINQ